MAEERRMARRRSMLPGSRRDRFVAAMKVGLLGAAGLLGIMLVLLPVFNHQEFSFLLSKDSTQMAGERMRVQEARYRGQTSEGEPFEIMARSGVQKSSAVPIVQLQGLSARLQQAEGEAIVTAPSGEFLIEQNRLVVDGPVIARSATGYSLDGERILVDLNSRRVIADRPVSGTLPMGSFRADSFAADLSGHQVRLEGGVNLRITPDRNKS